MLGFEARYVRGSPTPRDGELEDVAWFSRDEVAAAAAEDGAGRLLLPPRLAIARRLVDAWIGS
jgi:NAD+ diphosphatase